MTLLRSHRCRAALTGAVMALGLITVLAVAGTPATAATGSSSHISTATQETLTSSSLGLQEALTVAKAAHAGYEGKTLISSPWGLHTPSITARTCSSSTAHWFTLHINYDGGPYGWYYQCFGFQGTWYFIVNNTAWTCSGNNYGHYEWYPASGGEAGYNFGTAWSRNWPQTTDTDYLTINGWSGSYNCP